MNTNEEQIIKHDIIIKSRKRTEMTGISDVTSFDDGTIVAQSDKFGISIEGENLKIERFNAESGEFVSMEETEDAYTDESDVDDFGFDSLDEE